MAKIGATPNGGVQRLTLTKEDKRARDLLISWLKEIDMEVKVDEIGNIFGTYKGKNPKLEPVTTGSHVDSQPKGGRFDGIYGVMGALEVMRTMHDHGVVPERPVMLVDWTNEEGSRFAPAMLGSGVWAGVLDLDWAYNRTDINGKRLGDELEAIGYKGKVPARRWPVHAHYELHIEQGPVLDREGLIIGAPKGILCLHWYDIHVGGEANQVGPTPMEGRHDALCAASEMILKAEQLPKKMGGNMVTTVGELHVQPNSRNIIPDGVHFTVDIRSWDDAMAIRAWEDLEREFKEIGSRRGCPTKTEITWRVNHQPFNERLVNKVVENAEKRGYPLKRMVSGAGHDSSYMNHVAPTAMIFAPSVNGRSHVECELTKWEDCEAGANVLLDCVMQTANEA